MYNTYVYGHYTIVKRDLTTHTLHHLLEQRHDVIMPLFYGGIQGGFSFLCRRR